MYFVKTRERTSSDKHLNDVHSIEQCITCIFNYVMPCVNFFLLEGMINWNDVCTSAHNIEVDECDKTFMSKDNVIKQITE